MFQHSTRWHRRLIRCYRLNAFNSLFLGTVNRLTWDVSYVLIMKRAGVAAAAAGQLVLQHTCLLQQRDIDT